MLTGVASKVLKQLLSDYVEGFSLDDFSMSGKLYLHNLTIKPEILERFYLPVRVRAGQVASLSISGKFLVLRWLLGFLGFSFFPIGFGTLLTRLQCLGPK